jgi:hypothetical protein
MTEKSETFFRTHAEKREHLEGILNDPVFREAFEIIQDKAKARHVPEPRMHAHLDTLMSQQYYKILGIQYALDSFSRLTRPNPVESVGNDEEDPFFHSLPETMKEAIRMRKNEIIT